jgi:hypothetical protein
MEKGIEFSLTDVLDGVELVSDAILDVDPPDGFKAFKGEDFILPLAPKNVSPRVRWRLTGAGSVVLDEFPGCGRSSGLSRFNLNVGSISSR